MALIVDAVRNVRIGEPTLFRNLAVFPLFGSDTGAADYLTLDEAPNRSALRLPRSAKAEAFPS